MPGAIRRSQWQSRYCSRRILSLAELVASLLEVLKVGDTSPLWTSSDTRSDCAANEREWNGSAVPTRYASPREVPRRRDPALRGQPGPEDRSWAVSSIESESRPNLGLLALGQASWLCSQSPDSSGFSIMKTSQKPANAQTRNNAILLCASSVTADDCQWCKSQRRTLNAMACLPSS